MSRLEFLMKLARKLQKKNNYRPINAPQYVIRSSKMTLSLKSINVLLFLHVFLYLDLEQRVGLADIPANNNPAKKKMKPYLI